MIDLQLADKTHDEQRQGEALIIDAPVQQNSRKLYIESYGCQMNFADSEIVASILLDQGFQTTGDYKEADVVFINTCSIRENAEQRVRNRLSQFGAEKRRNPKLIVGVLGCMAERLKSKFLEEEKLVDVVVGPDAYRDLPQLIGQVEEGQKAINVLLSREETYADISPVRLNGNGITAFISIMRGCDNMCSFCVVPFTRGRERSRDPHSILAEAQDLVDKGYKEVTLLGQNVDSYKWKGADAAEDAEIEVNFAQLLEKVALLSADLRVRFSTSHPKDITDEVLYTIAKYDNICNYIHLPVQSGSSRVLELMNRTYTREWYINRVDAIRKIIPGCAISSDIIAGFCTETEEEHQETLTMMDYVGYDFAFTFSYSERPGTLAARKLEDDIPEKVKSRRLSEILVKQQEWSLKRLQENVGKTLRILVEGKSKKSDLDYCGRNDQNAMVVFPASENIKPGQYANVGEYLRVGSSKVQKTDVRIIAATNVDVYNRVKSGKFREDLYYRLNTVPLRIPALHERKEDIYLLFRKFSADFSDKYRSPGIQLDPSAIQMLSNYSWPGNVRQLKNIAEQICVLEKERNVTAQALLNYIPNESATNLPALTGQQSKEDFTERDILYKVLFDMKKDMMELKKLVAEIIQSGGNTSHIVADNPHFINQLYQEAELSSGMEPTLTIKKPIPNAPVEYNYAHDAEEIEESLSLIDKESDLIKKALKKHKGKRKFAAQELGISERTLYRKIKELNLN
eukprot:gene13095-15402_t